MADDGLGFEPIGNDLGFEPVKQPMKKSSNSLMDYLAPGLNPNLYKGLLAGLAHGGENILSNADALRQFLQRAAPANQGQISSTEASKIGIGQALRPSGESYEQMLGVQPGYAGSLGKFVGEAAPMLATGGESALARILGAGAVGGATSEQPLQGAAMGAAGAGAGELVPAALKGLQAYSKKVLPTDKISELADKIFSGYKDYSTRAKNLYNTVRSHLGDKVITESPSDFLNLTKEESASLGPMARRRLNEFSAQPTFDNAHKLQSQLFKDANALHRSEKGVYEAQNLEEIRGNLKSKIDDWLKANYPHAYPDYKEASQLTATKVKPYEVNPTIDALAKGHADKLDLSPSELRTALKSFVKSDKVPESIKKSHELYSHIGNLNKTLSKAKNLESMTSLGSGALLGGALGGIPGAASGAFLAKLLSPSALHLLQTPAIDQATQAMTPFSQTLGKALGAYLNQNQERQP